jgi:hypothetical protein
MNDTQAMEIAGMATQSGNEDFFIYSSPRFFLKE